MLYHVRTHDTRIAYLWALSTYVHFYVLIGTPHERRDYSGTWPNSVVPGTYVNPFRTAVPIWGQITWNLSFCPENGTAVLRGLR